MQFYKQKRILTTSLTSLDTDTVSKSLKGDSFFIGLAPEKLIHGALKRT